MADTKGYTGRIRAKMKRRRLQPVHGVSLCDFCAQNWASDWHHIVTRYSVMGSEHDKMCADSEYLTALLCRPCHDIIDSDVNRDALLQKLYWINGTGTNKADRLENGKALMQQAMDKFEQAVGFTLPEIIYE